MDKLIPAKDIQTFALIIRSTWERGRVQYDAIREIFRRGCWLSDNQLKQAGLTKDEYHAVAIGYEPQQWPKALGGGIVWTSHEKLPVHVSSAVEALSIHAPHLIKSETT